MSSEQNTVSDVAVPGWDRALHQAAVEVASRAPSIHNTQPWLWVSGPRSLQLRADRSRQLSVADPDGHSVLISCGAALCLTEIALRAVGWDVTTHRLPDAADPDLLAEFTPTQPGPPSQEDAALVEAALRRRSDRRPFTPQPVPEQAVEALRAVAAGSGVFAHFPTRAEEQVNLAVAVSWADRVQRDDAAYIAEMKRWVRDEEVHVDGVPATAVPKVPAGHPRHTDVPVRDFEVGVSGRELIARDIDERPLIAVLLSESDSRLHHLQSGEAMMRLLLRAEQLGISGCPLSQAVDLLAFRTRVQTLMGWSGYPQMMLRLGYPAASDGSEPRTPRRAVASVLQEQATVR